MNTTSQISQILTSSIQSFVSRDPWSDEMLALWVPVVAYWIYSIFFHFMMKAQLPMFEKYRIHTVSDMEKRNRVSIGRVLSMVLLQQLIQIVLGVLVLHPTDPISDAISHENSLKYLTSVILKLQQSVVGQFDMDLQFAIYAAQFIYWAVIPTLQFMGGMIIMDAHQYFLHRLFHVNKFLYKHVHSHHHRLYVPYAFGALYNHPLEGFLLDSCGATLAFELTRMSPRLSMFFFTFSTLKTVDDHCGYALPWDPLQFFFGNNVQYHDIHHQSFGIKKNFSQPFFTFWDKILGTEMTMDEASKKGSYKKRVQ